MKIWNVDNNTGSQILFLTTLLQSYPWQLLKMHQNPLESPIHSWKMSRMKYHNEWLFNIDKTTSCMRQYHIKYSRRNWRLRKLGYHIRIYCVCVFLLYFPYVCSIWLPSVFIITYSHKKSQFSIDKYAFDVKRFSICVFFCFLYDDCLHDIHANVKTLIRWLACHLSISQHFIFFCLWW